MSAPRIETRAFPLETDLPIRQISPADLREVLTRGYADFMAMPSHLFFVGLIYPILGICLAAFAFGYDLLPLIYPLMTGFAIVGPLAAIGLYELSRRRELGQEPRWKDAAAVLRSPAIGSIAGLGAILLAIFVAWMVTAHVIYTALLGSVPAESYGGLIRTILTTPRGWALILVGNAVGGAFAVLAFVLTVISFPLMVDREVGVGEAVRTSVRAVKANPYTMVLWGAIVAGLLALGSIPLFVGLALVTPILGHATWHLYRRVVGD